MTIRWGIIGCGDVTEIKSGPGFQLAEGSELTWVMRRNGALAEDYARRHGVPNWTKDASQIIENPEVDAVYIATPPSSHHEYSLLVAAAGKPCYVEKPMARTYWECKEMADAFQKANQPLFVAFYRRGLPRFIRIKEMVEAGELGQITGVHYRFHADRHRTDRSKLPWRVDATQAGGGFVMDLGCHTLDILDFICGPLLHPTGRAANLAGVYEVEDTVGLTFKLENGAFGTAIWNFAAGFREDTIEIIGTNGKISLSTFSDEPIAVTHDNEVSYLEIRNPIHIQQPLIQTIVNELHGDGKCPSTGQSACRTAKILDVALSEYYGGREDAFWSRPISWPGRPSRL